MQQRRASARPCMRAPAPQPHAAPSSPRQPVPELHDQQLLHARALQRHGLGVGRHGRAGQDQHHQARDAGRRQCCCWAPITANGIIVAGAGAAVAGGPGRRGTGARLLHKRLQAAAAPDAAASGGGGAAAWQQQACCGAAGRARAQLQRLVPQPARAAGCGAQVLLRRQHVELHCALVLGAEGQSSFAMTNGHRSPHLQSHHNGVQRRNPRGQRFGSHDGECCAAFRHWAAPAPPEPSRACSPAPTPRLPACLQVQNEDPTHRHLLRFNHAWQCHCKQAGGLLVYSTGRSPELFKRLWAEAPLITPGLGGAAQPVRPGARAAACLPARAATSLRVRTAELVPRAAAALQTCSSAPWARRCSTTRRACRRRCCATARP